jgi:ribose-phosphate pyrophosphokinase
VSIAFPERGLFAGRPALIVDDIVSSGGTLIACAKALLAAGASTVDAVIIHALFPPEMMQSFRGAGIRSVRSTTSVPHPSNSFRLDRVLADALRKETGS